MTPAVRARCAWHGLRPATVALAALAAVACAARTPPPEDPATLGARKERGRTLYRQLCFMCHQLDGRGVPGQFPPLERSDYLAADPKRAIHVVVFGLAGKIRVNGVDYDNAMPAFPLDDQQIADVLTYVGDAFGNRLPPVTAAEVAAVRAAAGDLQAVADPNPYPPLPEAPPGFTLREVARLPTHPARLLPDGAGGLYVLHVNGDVWRVEPATGALREVLTAESYLVVRGDPQVTGMAFDRERRFYLVDTTRVTRSRLDIVQEVTIYRTEPTPPGQDPRRPKPWFRTRYRHIDHHNHGAGHIALGPDGFLYVASGSRTDGGGPAYDPSIADHGETSDTALIWRFDPRADAPTPEVFARGLRNPYGFCWNRRGELIVTDNGPDADAPEELNLVERGRHYGFPYRYADWTEKPYSFTPDPPPGQLFTLPIANLGPDGGYAGKPLFTFDAHSSPAGIIYMGGGAHPAWRGSYLTVRFGNMIKVDHDVGFDLLRIRLRSDERGHYVARVERLLAPLARPIDLAALGDKLYIAEYSRQTSHAAGLGLPGRILEFAPAP